MSWRHLECVYFNCSIAVSCVVAIIRGGGMEKIGYMGFRSKIVVEYVLPAVTGILRDRKFGSKI